MYIWITHINSLCDSFFHNPIIYPANCSHIDFTALRILCKPDVSLCIALVLPNTLFNAEAFVNFSDHVMLYGKSCQSYPNFLAGGPLVGYPRLLIQYRAYSSQFSLISGSHVPHLHSLKEKKYSNKRCA
jgi:hypothetical protein